jgi:hypothetical protein
VKTASMHQQRSGLLPVSLAFSMAQTLSSPQMGQRVGSMLVMNTLYLQGTQNAGQGDFESVGSEATGSVELVCAIVISTR